MAKRMSKKITPPTPEQKKQRLEKQNTEWSAEDYKYSIEYCYTMFKMDRRARNSTEPTLAAYDRMYKKLLAHLDSISNGKGKETPVAWLTEEGAQYFFQLSLGIVSQQTINHYLRHYRAFGNYCEEKGYIQGFTCHIKEVEPPIKELYTDAELKKLLAKPNKDKFEEFRNHCIISLILATGARSHTIRTIKIEDVDLAAGYINFNVTKAHKVVRLGLERKVHNELAEYIQEWRTTDYGTGAPIAPIEPLFCSTYGEPLSRQGLIHAIAAYNKRRGVEKTSIHLLRHTFAKNWITSGGDIISLARVLTHSELEMVKRYANLYASDVKEEIEQHSTLSQLKRASGETMRTMKRKPPKNPFE